MHTRPSVGVALGGGAALGIAHIGVLRALREHRIPVQSIAGTSAGAVVAACHAFGIDEAILLEKLHALSWRTISHLSFAALGPLSNSRLGDLLTDVLGDPRIEDAHIPLAIVAADIATGEKVVFREGDVVDAVLASTAIPGVFAPVTIDGRMLVDGGIVENLPVAELDALGADVKIGVNVIERAALGRPKHLFGVLGNALEILYLQQYAPPAADEVRIEPDLRRFTLSDFAKAPELIAAGYDAAIQATGDIYRLIDAKQGPLRRLLNRWKRL